MESDASNLPKWPGASEVYSKAYRVLKAMALRGHAKPAVRYTNGRRWIQTHPGWVSEEMTRLIEALNKGDEETIKGLLLMTHIYNENPA